MTEYPLPICNDPLTGVTDSKLVEYWIKNGLVERIFRYHEYDIDGTFRYFGLYRHAETVDILFQLDIIDKNPEFTHNVCNTITMNDIMDFYAYSTNISLISFRYKLPNGDIYYSIIELLKNIKEDDTDTYIDRYIDIYPNIELIISTLPYEKCKMLLQKIVNRGNNNKYEISDRTFQEYLLCSTIFNTFNPYICSLFLNMSYTTFFTLAGKYSPYAIHHIINGDKCLKLSHFSMQLDKVKESIHQFHPKSLDLIYDSKVYTSVLPLLYAYIKLNNIDKVKLILDDNQNNNNQAAAAAPACTTLDGMVNDTCTTPDTDSMVDNTCTGINISETEVLHYATTSDMVHLLVSYKANVNATTRKRRSHIRTAVEKCSLDVVKALLYHKVDLSLNESGEHIIHWIDTSCRDIVEFIIPFLSSSTSDISIHMKHNNTTGLPEDIYNYIKTSLSYIDINIADKYGRTPLLQALSSGIHVSYLLSNNAYPHLYKQTEPFKPTIITTFKDIIPSVTISSITPSTFTSSAVSSAFNSSVVPSSFASLTAPSSFASLTAPSTFASLTAPTATTPIPIPSTATNHNIHNNNDTFTTTTTLFNPLSLHYIDSKLLDADYSPSYSQIYPNLYNLMLCKAYPLTYTPNTITRMGNNNPNTPTQQRPVYYSHLIMSIQKRHFEFMQILLRYLTPVNMLFRISQFSPFVYPLELALHVAFPLRDIIFELIQYGCVYNPSRKFEECHDNVKMLILDQCFDTQE